MTPALDDPEDPPALEREPLMTAFRAAETEPATRPENEVPLPGPPGVPDSLVPTAQAATTEPAAEGIADAILKRLQPSIDNIWRELAELRRLRESDDLRLHAIDNGVAGLFTQVGNLEDKVDVAIKVSERVADGLFAVSKDLQDLRTSTINQASHDGEQVRELRQSVADLERAGTGGQ